MLRDYRTWLVSQAERLRDRDPAGGLEPADAQRALERFDAETADGTYVRLERPLAMRILTTLEMIGQQTTSVRPELEALRSAIKTAFENATG